MQRILAMLAVIGLLAACSQPQPPAEPDLAEQAVPQFHMALLDRDFAGIYQRAGDELKRQQSEADFVARLVKVRAALGEIRGAERSATQIDGRRVTLSYQSEYANGKASEEFVILAEEGREPMLIGYRLLEPQLP